MLRKRPARFTLLLCLASLLAACLPVSPHEASGRPWTYADLRALDAPDDLPPALDLIALYTRIAGEELQVRLDLLDLASDLEGDITLVLDYRPGGARGLFPAAWADVDWDLRVNISASGRLQAWRASGEEVSALKLRVRRDPLQDTVIVQMDRGLLSDHGYALKSDHFKIQAFSTRPNSPIIQDRIGPSARDLQPAGRAHLLIAFWNTFPFTTPAQALRGWFGAHSGPQNTRHGLRSVIDAVQSTRIPVFLLDLKMPASLSSLDYLGGLERVRELARQGLLVLPEAIPFVTGSPGQSTQPPGWVFRQSALAGRRTTIAFDLPTSPSIYIPGNLSVPYNDYAKWCDFLRDALPPQAPLVFLHPFPPISAVDPVVNAALFSPQFLSRWQGAGLIGLPAPAIGPASSQPAVTDLQATLQGPSPALRRALASLAFHATNAPDQPFLLLGGDLARSTWGNPQPAASTLRYFAEHPWIRVLGETDLLAAHPQSQLSNGCAEAIHPMHSQPFLSGSSPELPIQSELDTAQAESRLLRALDATPPGPLTDLAWQAYASLYAPAVPDFPALHRLRAAYLGQIGHLLAAAQWAARGPGTICRAAPAMPCTIDVDWDGQEEIILETNELFAIFEPYGGILTYAFSRLHGTVHQVIGPSSQFMVGLSDPMLWQAELGPAGDPGQLPGAFADRLAGDGQPILEAARRELAPGTITFLSQGGAISKRISLIPDGMRIEYQAAQGLSVQIPLAIDPWIRFQPGWGDLYQEKPFANGWAWGLESGFSVGIRTSGELSTRVFTASRSELRLPEDPNYPYPAGHYLPYPLALVEIRGEGQFDIQIHWLPGEVPEG